MRNALIQMKATPYETKCAFLAAYAESRFYNDRRQLMQDGVNYTVGMFQQSARWGWTGLTNITAATQDFIMALRRAPFNENQIVADIWQVQRWNAPDPSVNYSAFWVAPETLNYVNCLKHLEYNIIMDDPFYFTNGGHSL